MERRVGVTPRLRLYNASIDVHVELDGFEDDCGLAIPRNRIVEQRAEKSSRTDCCISTHHLSDAMSSE